jgi:hypothetical protein
MARGGDLEGLAFERSDYGIRVDALDMFTGRGRFVRYVGLPSGRERFRGCDVRRNHAAIDC